MTGSDNFSGYSGKPIPLITYGVRARSGKIFKAPHEHAVITSRGIHKHNTFGQPFGVKVKSSTNFLYKLMSLGVPDGYKGSGESKDSDITNGCRHLCSIYFLWKMGQEVAYKAQRELEGAEAKTGGCTFCGSTSTVKIGFRHNVHGDVQRLLCKTCGHKFSKGGFEKVKATVEVIVKTLDLHFKGLSQRKIVEQLETIDNVKVTQPCVLKWIRKYIRLMGGYVERFPPQLRNTKYFDEIMVDVREAGKVDEGKYTRLWHILDRETRFLIASEVTKHRNIEDAKKILQEANVEYRHEPPFVIIDPPIDYSEAFLPKLFEGQLELIM